MTLEERQRFREVTGRRGQPTQTRPKITDRINPETKWRKLDHCSLPNQNRTEQIIDISKPRELNSFDPTTSQNASMHKTFPSANQTPTTFSLANEMSASFKPTNQDPSTLALANTIDQEQKLRLEKLQDLELRIRTMEKLMKEI